MYIYSLLVEYPATHELSLLSRNDYHNVIIMYMGSGLIKLMSKYLLIDSVWVKRPEI